MSEEKNLENFKSKKLLIIDDDQMSSTLTKKKLEKRGFNCDALTSAQSFLEQLKQGDVDYDLILLDIMMPDISGIEVLELIREVKDSTQLPVIMVTSKDEAEDIVGALKLGANDYLTKPLNLDIAMARINTQLTVSELVNSTVEAKQINTINSMVTTLNHEINNPLAIAIGNLTIAKERLDAARIEKALGALDRITQIVKKIERISENEIEEVEYSTSSNMYKFK